MVVFFLGLNVSVVCMDMVDVLNNNGYMLMVEYVFMCNEFGVKVVIVKISEGGMYKDLYVVSNIVNV